MTIGKWMTALAIAALAVSPAVAQRGGRGGGGGFHGRGGFQGGSGSRGGSSFGGGGGFRAGGFASRGGGFASGGSYRGGGARPSFRSSYSYRGWGGGYRPSYGYRPYGYRSSYGYRPYFGYGSGYGSGYGYGGVFALGLLGGYAIGASPYLNYAGDYYPPSAYPEVKTDDYPTASGEGQASLDEDAPPLTDRPDDATSSDDQADTSAAAGDHCPLYWDKAAGRYVPHCDEVAAPPRR